MRAAKNTQKRSCGLAGVGVALAALFLSACASKATNPTGKSQAPSVYLVQSGDTVSKIAARYGLDWRQISRLNNLDEKHTIYVGQRLQLPSRASAQSQNQNAKAALDVQKQSSGRSVATDNPTSAGSPTFASSGNAAPLSNLPPVVISQDLTRFRYPVGKDNSVARNFGTPTSSGFTEGMFFMGRAGDEVVASSAGTVTVASDQQGRSIVLIDHGELYSSAYLDLRNIRVRAGQNVQAGDAIGYMAAQTSNGTALFEFRIAKNGRYIDPVSVLR